MKTKQPIDLLLDGITGTIVPPERMKISEAAAKKQAKRLMANPMLAPQSPEGQLEIMNCLMRHCESPEHAERTMTELLDGTRDPRNITAEIAAAARLTRKGAALPAGCDRCRYTDVDTGQVQYYAHVSGTRNGYDYAERCGCARGRALRHLDTAPPPKQELAMLKAWANDAP